MTRPVRARVQAALTTLAVGAMLAAMLWWSCVRAASAADVPDVHGDQLLFFYDARAYDGAAAGAAERTTFVNVVNPASRAILVEVARYPADLSAPTVVTQRLGAGENHVFDVAQDALGGAGSAGLVVVTPIRDDANKRTPIVPPVKLGGSFTVAGPYNGFGENALARSVSGERDAGAVVDGVEQRYEVVRPLRGVLMLPTYYDPGRLSDVEHDGNRVVLVAFEDRYEAGAWTGIGPPDPAPMIRPTLCSATLGPAQGAAVEVSGVYLADLATLAGKDPKGSSGSVYFEPDEAFRDAPEVSLFGLFSQALGHLGAGHRLAVTARVPACGTPVPGASPTPVPTIVIPVCGNGKAEGNVIDGEYLGEDCDKQDLGAGRDCAGVIGGTSVGAACAGELRCTSDCTYDVSGCEPCRCERDRECLVAVDCEAVVPGCGEQRICHAGFCLATAPSSGEETRSYCEGSDPGDGKPRCGAPRTEGIRR